MKYGAVSYETCLSMVKNLSKISKSDIAVSITGIAGPSGGSKLKPIGLVFIGIKLKNNIIINKFIFKNKGRVYIRRSAVKKTLKIILENI